LQKLIAKTDQMGMARDPDATLKMSVTILESDDGVSEDDAKRALVEAKQDFEAGGFDSSQCPDYEEMGGRLRLSRVRPY
jgi:hypothetical protein